VCLYNYLLVMKITKPCVTYILLLMPTTSIFAVTDCEHASGLNQLNEHLNQSITDHLFHYSLLRLKHFNEFMATYFKQNQQWVNELIWSKQYTQTQLKQKLIQKNQNIFQSLNTQFVKIAQQRANESALDDDYHYIAKYENLLKPYVAMQLEKQQKQLLMVYDGHKDQAINEFFQYDIQEDKLLKQQIQQNFHFKFTEIKTLNQEHDQDKRISYCQMKLMLNPQKSVILEYAISQFVDEPDVLLMPMEFKVNTLNVEYEDIGHYLILK
jgi:hypothetical protein